MRTIATSRGSSEKGVELLRRSRSLALPLDVWRRLAGCILIAAIGVSGLTACGDQHGDAWWQAKLSREHTAYHDAAVATSYAFQQYQAAPLSTDARLHNYQIFEELFGLCQTQVDAYNKDAKAAGEHRGTWPEEIDFVTCRDGFSISNGP